jgi:hypothetical protein
MVEVDADEYELDPGAISDEDQANLIEEVLHDSDEEDETETSAVEASDCLDVQWDYTVSFDVLGLFHNSLLGFHSLVTPTVPSFQT